MEPIKPNKSSSPPKPSSGRISFMGFDMAFLCINGNEMFTLHEVLGNIFPDTARSTVIKRFEKLRAARHLCSKDEISLLKSIGGIRSCAVNCGMVAREAIEEYFVKYVDTNESSSDSAPALHVGIRSESEERQSGSSNVDANANDNCDQGIKDIYKDVIGVAIERETTGTAGDSGEPNIKLTQHPPSEVSEPDAVLSPSKQIHKNNEEGNNSVKLKGLPRVKRKRRTNLEILELHNGETSCGIINNKRERKVYYAGYEKPTLTRKAQKPSVLTHSSDTSQQLCSSTPKQKNKQNTLNEGEIHENTSDKELHLEFQFDENNNLEPRSPTFLLKRSVNNEWHIASSTMSTLDHNEDQALASASHAQTVKQSKSSPNQGVKRKAVKMKSNCQRRQGQGFGVGKRQRPKSSTNSLPHKLPRNKPGNKVGRNLKPTKITKKHRPCNARKTEAMKANDTMNVLPKDEVPASTVSRNDFQCGVLTDNGTHTPNGYVTVNTMLEGKGDEPKIPLFKRRTPVKEQSGDGCEIPNAVSEEGINKPKRRRRVQQNTFHLAETFPYPPSLMVKDGDLYPAYTMIYSSVKDDPGCCHALWRWRLGRPVRPVACIKNSPTTVCPVSEPKIAGDTSKEDPQDPLPPKDDEELLHNNNTNVRDMEVDQVASGHVVCSDS